MTEEEREELRKAIERLRENRDYMERIQANVKRDKELLDRLADS